MISIWTQELDAEIAHDDHLCVAYPLLVDKENINNPWIENLSWGIMLLINGVIK